MREKPTDQQLLVKILYLTVAVIHPLATVNTPGVSCIVWPEINMFGFGKERVDAEANLLDCLKEYYEMLDVEEGSLNPIPQRDYDILNKFFNR